MTRSLSVAALIFPSYMLCALGLARIFPEPYPTIILLVSAFWPGEQNPWRRFTRKTEQAIDDIKSQLEQKP